MSITNQQARALLNSIQKDPQFSQSTDTILLAEEQYPNTLDSIFNKLDTSTSLQDTITLLRWHRKHDGATLQKDVLEQMVLEQAKLRTKVQLNPTTDNPWDANTFLQWKYFVTNLCLSGVQDALKHTENSKHLHYLFSPANADSINTTTHKSTSNIQGLLMYHPILLNSPWEAPDDIDSQIDDLINTKDPTLVARSRSTDPNTFDADKARNQIQQLKTSILQVLHRIYILTSNTFHVLLIDLIPRARSDGSHLFNHIKGARTTHIISLREYKDGKRPQSLPPLEPTQIKIHSAAHTLAFIEENYVDKDDDAPHYAWDGILKTTRQPKTTIFAWVESFQLLKARYAATIDGKISKKRTIKINQVIVNQITDNEKRTIATLNTTYTSLVLQQGDFKYDDLSKLLAHNTSSFTETYIPRNHPRIIRYLRARAKRNNTLQELVKLLAPINTPTKIITKRKRPETQRQWNYLQSSEPSAKQYRHDHHGKGKSPKGKGKWKGKGKYKGKFRGKDLKGSSSKGTPRHNSKVQHSTESSSQTSLHSTKTSGDFPTFRCHFCHQMGHIKANCRKFAALQKSPTYKQRYTHSDKYQLIYDHLEDSVLAPRSCPYCTDTSCDGTNCDSPFEHDDYHEASTFFTDTLSTLVLNAKLERPLESHAPQLSLLFNYDDNWGEEYLDEQVHHKEPIDNTIDNQSNWEDEIRTVLHNAEQDVKTTNNFTDNDFASGEEDDYEE